MSNSVVHPSQSPKSCHWWCYYCRSTTTWPQRFSTEALKRAYVANKNLAFDTSTPNHHPWYSCHTKYYHRSVSAQQVNIDSSTAAPFSIVHRHSKQRVEYLSRRSSRLRTRWIMNRQLHALDRDHNVSMFPTRMSYSLQHQHHHHSDIMVALQEPEAASLIRRPLLLSTPNSAKTPIIIQQGPCSWMAQ
jgi:hypothetical protein